MSYSRWSNSIWYTFWVYSGKTYKFKLPKQKFKDEQILEICDFPSYLMSYGDIKSKGIDTIINDVKEYYSKEHPGRFFDGVIDGVITFKDGVYDPKNPSDEELNELKGYINEFVKDVDEHFTLWNFIKNEWGLIYIINKFNYFFIKWKHL